LIVIIIALAIAVLTMGVILFNQNQPILKENKTINIQTEESIIENQEPVSLQNYQPEK
jgi:hypothetical protein